MEEDNFGASSVGADSQKSQERHNPFRFVIIAGPNMTIGWQDPAGKQMSSCSDGRSCQLRK